MENIKEEIRETLDKKNFCYKKLTFLAGDASERKYFDLIHKNKKYVVMYDKDNENLKEKTEELDERVSELTKKIEIFLNQ